VVNIEDQISEAVKAQEFLVVSSQPLALTTPKEGEFFEYLAEKPKLELEWEREAQAASYKLEVARDADFRKLAYQQKVETNAHRVSDLAEDGKYFWRIRALEASGAPIRTSPVATFTLQAKELVAAPKLQAPAADFVHLTPETETEVEFEWEPVKGAVEYEVVLTPVNDRSPASEEGRIAQRFNENRGKVRQIATVDYNWSVRSIDTHGRPGKLAPVRRLSVKQDDVLPPPDEVELEIKQTRTE
jgi:hypothetical protein